MSRQSFIRRLYDAVSGEWVGSAPATPTRLAGIDRHSFWRRLVDALAGDWTTMPRDDIYRSDLQPVSTSLPADRLAAIASRRYRSLLRRIPENLPPATWVVGVAGAAMVALAWGSVDLWWLLTLPPVLWLGYQTYGHRLRGHDERRLWQTFAETTRELNHVDEQDAVLAALRGARTLFGATEAEIIVDTSPGGSRVYTLHRDGDLTRVEPPTPTLAGVVATRTLIVDGMRIGELRLSRGTRLTRQDTMMLAAYGDAVANVLHDVTATSALRALVERGSHDANVDTLTGVGSRASLLARGTATLRSLEPSASAALLLLDIDRFREVNNTLGHAAGDELLRVVAQRLAGAVLPGEVLARLGGDEFALLLTTATAPLRNALTRARHLAEEIAAPIKIAGIQLSATVSVGVVAAVGADADMTELLRRADIAMYQAKRDGSRVGWYDTDRDDTSTDRLALLAELREALAGGEQIDVLLQPMVALPGGHPVGVEALVRWRHPRRGTLTPVDFLPVVEYNELLDQFNRCVLDRVLSVARALADAGIRMPVGVDLSPRGLRDRKLATDLAQMLDKHGVSADLLTIEITETALLDGDDGAETVLRSLHDLGVRLSIDDFGTGFANLGLLRRVPVDEVKIDRSFVAHMIDSPEAAAIVRSTIGLGGRLGLNVVAEGVETAEQHHTLARLGCRVAQGFHFYPLMSRAEMVDMLWLSRTPRSRRLETVLSRAFTDIAS